jgi:hypothetical protein
MRSTLQMSRHYSLGFALFLYLSRASHNLHPHQRMTPYFAAIPLSQCSRSIAESFRERHRPLPEVSIQSMQSDYCAIRLNSWFVPPFPYHWSN